jgi:hypothetical protein
MVIVDPAANRAEETCGQPPAALSGFGGACGSSKDCQSGVCFMGTGGGCSTPCIDDTSCGGAFPQCLSQSFTLPGGGTQSLMVCSP